MERGLPGWFMRLKYSDKNWSLSNAVLRRDEALMVRRAITHHVPMNRKNHSRYRKKKTRPIPNFHQLLWERDKRKMSQNRYYKPGMSCSTHLARSIIWAHKTCSCIVAPENVFGDFGFDSELSLTHGMLWRRRTKSAGTHLFTREPVKRKKEMMTSTVI